MNSFGKTLDSAALEIFAPGDLAARSALLDAPLRVAPRVHRDYYIVIIIIIFVAAHRFPMIFIFSSFRNAN